jgi:hypothetical protein
MIPCFETLSKQNPHNLKNPHNCRTLMSVGDDTAPVDEEYHCEEHRDQRTMDSKQPAPKFDDIQITTCIQRV